jgi:CDP-glycerol glycerophosphotransferase (TagB/SpsB family)/GT2 family glycosyltransferase
MNHYLFSVVIPIYNVENYLEETILSVVGQDIGLDRIQIILVNDESPDDSESICLKYKALYPNNIIYIKQKNAGVSAARNNGLAYASGDYVNFLDSDDKWEPDVFRKAHNMFLSHDEIDVIGVRQKYFEALHSYPSLDYKFDRDKVIDIFEDYDHIQLSVTSGFVRRNAIGQIRFDERVTFSEDAKFLYEVIFQKEKLGILSSSLHLYRKRHSGNSLIQTKHNNTAWYLSTPKLCYQYVFQLSRQKYGYVIPFAQYYVAYDYQWRINEMSSDLEPEIKEEYLAITRELFAEIDIRVIMKLRSIHSEYKVALTNMKLGKDITTELRWRRNRKGLFYGKHKIFRFNSPYTINMTQFTVGTDQITVRGLVNTFIAEEHYDIYAVVNKEHEIKLELEDTEKHIRLFFGEKYLCVKSFSIEFPLVEFQNLKFRLVYKERRLGTLNFSIGGNVNLDKKTKLYFKKENKIFYYFNEAIRAKPNTLGNRVHFALRKLKFNLAERKYAVVGYRLAYHVCKLFKRKQIWLISDRTNAANDNGLHFFKYINKPGIDINSYFVIDGNCHDYEMLKQIGKVLKLHSFRYKLTFLLADKVISSQFDGWVTNAFGNDKKYYRDLYDFDYVFLQHGVTAQNDISKWVNIHDKNIRLFITSALKEYQWLTNNKNFGFNKAQVKLTGMARYDNLESEPDKIIAIMPTWRTYLSGKYHQSQGVRGYSGSFRNSEYFNFYNSLINDPKLLQVMGQKGYRGIFVVHPSHKENHIDFQRNGTFDIIEGVADYQKIFKKASLLVSDYSSVIFDFAYLKKPVIHTMFDKKTYGANHMKPGYFDYETDGFGPLTYTYTETVDTIIEYINNGCVPEKKYQDRVRRFFAFDDKCSCERIYQEILQL